MLRSTIEQLKNDYLQQNFKTEERNLFIFKMANAFEDFAMKYGQYHLNEPNPHFNNNYKNLGK